MSALEPVPAALAFTRALEELGIEYVVGGSVASMVYGEVRLTVDVDVVVDLALERVDALSARLQAEFFCDAEALREAVRERTHFNVYYRPTMFRVDAFLPGTDAFEREQWARRRRLTLAGSSTETAWVTDAESIVLRKLAWFRKGGEVSEQQWRDVLAVLKVQAERLDRAWLATWADRLAVRDLLDRALAEAGLAP